MQGGLGALVGAELHEPAGLEHPLDRRHRQHLAVAFRQVIVHRLGSGVETVARQRLVDLDDLVLSTMRDGQCFGLRLRGSSPAGPSDR